MQTEHLVLRGGRVLCPVTGRDEVKDIWIANGKIAGIGDLPGGSVGREVDCSGTVISVGFTDLGAELCDPGMCWREDLVSGSEAGAAGGFTTIVASPKTEPTIDTPMAVRELLVRAATVSGARVEIAGALTQKLKGEALSELGLMAEAGAVAFSDGGRPMENTGVARRVLDYARPFGLAVMVRPGDTELEGAGVMHEGDVSVTLGLRGIPAAAEEIGVARAIALARLTGTRLHLSAVTTIKAIALVRAAKADGVAITAAVPARHLVLTDAVVEDSVYDTATRLLPPLRSEADRVAAVAAVKDGTLDVIGADHVPHTRIEKELEYMHAKPGAVGLESALRAALTGLDGDVSALVQAMAVGPASVLGRSAEISLGAPADLVVFDCDVVQVQPDTGRSKGINEPLAGHELHGRVRLTIRDGCIIYGPHLG
jgi:dihydroorotase